MTSNISKTETFTDKVFSNMKVTLFKEGNDYYILISSTVGGITYYTQRKLTLEELASDKKVILKNMCK